MALFDHSDEPQNLQVDEVGKAYLLETARWGAFLGILGFIGVGFLVLAGLFMMIVGGTVGSMSNAYSGLPFGFGFIGFFYIIGAALYFYPTLMMYNFSIGIKRSLPVNDQQQFNEALSKLRNKVKFNGILTIVIISVYIIIIIFAIVAAIVSNV